MISKNLIKRMGVMNITPNSFSDGGELNDLKAFSEKIFSFGSLDAIDIGAESTAPMNSPISWKEEWDRLKVYLPRLKLFSGVISVDTYHPETIEEVLKFFKDEKLENELFWNDVSGKFDRFTENFLKRSSKFSYIFCHNLAPSRDLSGKHMDYINPELSLNTLNAYFLPRKHPQVIFDPCLGFSKTYDQNWMVLNHFKKLQEMNGHNRWLLGFSRKSFLRKKFNLTLDQKEELDQLHSKLIKEMDMTREVWIRTHRPELI